MVGDDPGGGLVTQCGSHTQLNSQLRLHNSKHRLSSMSREYSRQVPRLTLALAQQSVGEPKIGQCMELPEISPVPDWCHTSPSITNSELCEPEKKNSPLLKTLVPRPISCGSGSGTLTRSQPVFTACVWLLQCSTV